MEGGCGVNAESEDAEYRAEHHLVCWNRDGVQDVREVFCDCVWSGLFYDACTSTFLKDATLLTSSEDLTFVRR